MVRDGNAQAIYTYPSNLKGVKCGSDELLIGDIVGAGVATIESLANGVTYQDYPDAFNSASYYQDIEGRCGQYVIKKGEPTLDIDGKNWVDVNQGTYV